MLKVGLYQCHPEGLNKSKSINQDPGQMPRLKVGRGGKKSFSSNKASVQLDMRIGFR